MQRAFPLLLCSRGREKLHRILPLIWALGLAVLVPAGLGGCGFSPLYGKQDVGGGDVSSQLKQVFVANIPTRFGQTMRLALQQDMSGDGPEQPDGYILRADGSLAYEAVDIHKDNTSGRSRVVGWASWKLYSVGQTPHLMAEGYARTLDGYDPTINQYFAQSLNNEAVQERVSQNLAHEITRQVAVWFRSRQSLGPDHRLRAGQYLDLDAMPTDSGAAKVYYGVDGIPSSATGRLPAGASTTTGAPDSGLGGGSSPSTYDYGDEGEQPDEANGTGGANAVTDVSAGRSSVQ